MPTSRTRRASNVVAILTLVGASLGALAVTGLLLYRFFELRPWLYHPALFGVPGFVALAVAWGLGIGRPLLKWPGVIVLVLTAAGAGLVGWMTASVADQPSAQSRHVSPDGRMELVIYGGSGFVAPDPVWELRMHTRRGLLSRESDLGCVNSEILSLNRIDWVGPQTVRIGLSRGAIDINLDGDGRPDRTVEGGC